MSFRPSSTRAWSSSTCSKAKSIYRHGSNLYHMKPGDSLFFDADAPHGPEQLTVLPMRYLSIICYPQSSAG